MSSLTDCDVRAVAAALGERAEEVCRRYLPNGRRSGRYWTVGNVDGAKGRSMWVRLEPPGVPGKWMDAATGEHGDLLDLIRHHLGVATLGHVLEVARTVLCLPPARPASRGRSPAERTVNARRLWQTCQPLAGTRAEAYLGARGIVPGDRPALRFHPNLNYRDETGLRQLPALVVAITTNEGEFAGVHRTWLDPRAPVKACVAAPRKALGPIHGHAVRFAAATNGTALLVGEGIETVLSVLTAVPDLPGAAALSAPGLADFTPPPGVERLLIARDNDSAGRSAASRLRLRCRELGIDTTVLVPESGDFNDDLLALGPAVLAERIAPNLKPSRT